MTHIHTIKLKDLNDEYIQKLKKTPKSQEKISNKKRIITRKKSVIIRPIYVF